MEFEHGAEETVQKVFGDEKDFYEILGLKKTATQKEIKRAYRKMALKYVRRRFFVFRLYDSIFFLSIKSRMLSAQLVLFFGFLNFDEQTTHRSIHSASG